MFIVLSLAAALLLPRTRLHRSQKLFYLPTRTAQALAGFHVIQDIHVIKGINKKQILEAEIIMDHKIGTMTILYLMKSTKQCLSTRHLAVLLLSLKIYLDLLLLASHKQNKLCNNIIIYFVVTSTGAKKLLLLQKKQSNILL